MIVRIVEDGKVVIVDLPYTEHQEQEFIEKNPTGGFMAIDSLPTSELYMAGLNYKYDGSKVVADDNANTRDLITKQVAAAKKYLADTDYKDLPNYQLKDGEVLSAIILDRSSARAFIRGNETTEGEMPSTN